MPGNGEQVLSDVVTSSWYTREQQLRERQNDLDVIWVRSVSTVMR